MTHTPHELIQEFPECGDRIHFLKEQDGHFRELADSYHELNREIHRGETDVEPMGQFHLEELKKRRLALLDEIGGYLR
ncbi:MAG: DUF465 domain-containing protein [Alphaproteobacteria bacterium]|nr:DUF465 domain-containing protein [Alphaproteobacteria bacterium]